MQIHNRMSCAHRNKQNMHTQYTHTTNVKNALYGYTIRVLSEKYCRKTKSAQERERMERMRKKTQLWPVDIYHSSAPAQATATIPEHYRWHTHHKSYPMAFYR